MRISQVNIKKTILWGVVAIVGCWQAQTYSARLVDEQLGLTPVATAQSDADLLLSSSIQQLEKLRSFSANIDFEASLFGERHNGRGRYEEMTIDSTNEVERRRPLEATCFILRATIADNSEKIAKQKESGDENVLVAVCDAEATSWWHYSSVEGATSLRHINIEELENSLAALDEDEAAKLAESGVDNVCGMNGMPGLGGLAGTLKRIKATYNFNPNIDTLVSSQGEKTYRIVGKANETYINSAKVNLQVESFEPYILENLPLFVEVHFNADQRFPFKIVYYSEFEKNGKQTRNDVFAVEYSSIVRNDSSISEDTFNFTQPQVNFERVNSEYLEELIPGVRL